MQRGPVGDPKNPATQTVPYVPAAEFAGCSGFEGIKVDRPEDVGAAWDRALAADGPVLLEFVTDPQIPPLPPHVKPPRCSARRRPGCTATRTRSA